MICLVGDISGFIWIFHDKLTSSLWEQMVVSTIKLVILACKPIRSLRTTHLKCVAKYKFAY